MLRVNLFAYDYTGYGMAYEEGEYGATRVPWKSVMNSTCLPFFHFVFTRKTLRRVLLCRYRCSIQVPQIRLGRSSAEYCLVWKVTRVWSLMLQGSGDSTVQRTWRARWWGHPACPIFVCISYRIGHGMHSIWWQVSQYWLRPVDRVASLPSARYRGPDRTIQSLGTNVWSTAAKSTGAASIYRGNGAQ
jgi:hypothetical protein